MPSAGASRSVRRSGQPQHDRAGEADDDADGEAGGEHAGVEGAVAGGARGDRVEDDDAEQGADRVDQRALPLEHRPHPVGGADEGEQGEDDGRAGDDEQGADHPGDAPAEAEDQLRRAGDRGEGEQRADADQAEDDAPHRALQLVDFQPQPGLEQDQADAERDQRLEGVAEQRFGVDVFGDRAGEEADRQQQHDRRQPEALGDDPAGDRQHHDQAEPGEDLVRRQHAQVPVAEKCW